MADASLLESLSTQLLMGMGTFWSSLYPHQDVHDYLRGLSAAGMQESEDFARLLDSLSPFTIRDRRRRVFREIRFLESELLTGMPLRYGGGQVYGPQSDGTTLTYGGRSGTATALEMTSGPRGSLLACDRLLQPQTVLVGGSDFVVRYGSLYFITNPFDLDGFELEPRYDDAGAVVDREIRLWLVGAEEDDEAPRQLYGMQLNAGPINQLRPKNYVEACRLGWSSVLDGASELSLSRALGILTGVPVASGDETVEAVTSDRRGKLVITDRSAYRLPEESSVLVSVGQVLSTGQTLCDAFTILDPKAALPEALTEIRLPTGLLVGDFSGPVGFENSDEVVTYEEDDDDLLYLSFPLTGAAADTTLFWDLANAAAREEDGTPLEEIINPSITINPARFAMDSILGYNVAVVMLEPDSYGSGADAAMGRKALAMALAPGSAALLIYPDGSSELSSRRPE